MGTKAALITGSARRIGHAIAVHLAGEGIHDKPYLEEAPRVEAAVRGADWRGGSR